MTRTVIESKTKTVIIGFDEPFCVIGERINPTGRKKLAAELEAGNFETVLRDALEQVACGATVLDVNSGAVFTNKMAEDPRYADNNFVEPPLMRELILRIQEAVDVPLCIDSSVPGALEAGLQACEGRPLLNSVTGEEERLERVLPLVKKYNVPVVAISNDDTGISQDPDVRFAVAKKIVQRAADFGIPAHDIVVDPLVMPVGAMGSAGQQVFALVRRLREELGVNTTCGASNISFGLPHRHGINAAFLPMAIGAGMTSRHHEPGAPGRDGGDPRRQLPDEPRRQWRRMDPLCQGAGGGRRRHDLCRSLGCGLRRHLGPSRRPSRARLRREPEAPRKARFGGPFPYRMRREIRCISFARLAISRTSWSCSRSSGVMSLRACPCRRQDQCAPFIAHAHEHPDQAGS